MAHLASLRTTTTATPARTTERRGSADPGTDGPSVASSFESVAELGCWVRVAVLGVIAPELLLADLNDERRAPGALFEQRQPAAARL